MRAKRERQRSVCKGDDCCARRPAHACKQAHRDGGFPYCRCEWQVGRRLSIVPSRFHLHRRGPLSQSHVSSTPAVSQLCPSHFSVIQHTLNLYRASTAAYSPHHDRPSANHESVRDREACEYADARVCLGFSLRSPRASALSRIIPRLRSRPTKSSSRSSMLHLYVLASAGTATPRNEVALNADAAEPHRL
jgi:hypothetical protein